MLSYTRQWNAETISNDISLIKLPFPIDFNGELCLNNEVPSFLNNLIFTKNVNVSRSNHNLFSEYIQPVALPKKSGQHDDYVGEQAIATGWGLTSDSKLSIV